MIDIQTALYNILHSRYGKDVRQSIHDGIYQINENANEAVQTAKAMGVGTAVSSATSSSTGYVAGNLYLNNSTWDLWKCLGTNSWQNVGNIKGATGSTGADGTSNYIFIRYSQYYDGTDFTVNPTASSQYIGIYAGSSNTAPTNKADYQWAAYVGASGTSSYIHIKYSSNADGEGFVDVPSGVTKYIGIYTGTSSTAPANKLYYTWSKYVGDSGSGSGDMLKSEYAGSGVAGAVDRAITADSATSATNATNASNLKGSNGTTTSADDITAKLSKLDSSGKIEYSDVKNTPTIPTVSDTYSSTSSNAMSGKAVASAVSGKADSSTTLAGYGITNAYTKTEVDNKVDSWFSQTQQATATGEQTVTFTGLTTTNAYELWFETSDGSQVGIKSSSLSGTSMSYVIDIPSTCPVPVNFKLRVVR